MTIQEIIEARNIRQILHFTTSDGLLGMLAGQPPSLLPRAQLSQESHLEFILTLNSPIRKDEEWTTYNSLSITRINRYFFKYSLRNHPNAYWAILAFSPEILTHPGVVFATTNNIYPDVERGEGPEGLNRLFAPTIRNRGGNICRQTGHTPNCPTDIQAEVLYPGALSFDFLQEIYVPNEEAKRLIDAQVQFHHKAYTVRISPGYFNEL